jgi:hypothetical protein
MTRSRKRVAIVICTAVILVAGLILIRSGSEAPTPSPIPLIGTSPTPAVDSTTIEKLSRDFAAKYYTYEDPAGAAYLSGIKPYLDPPLFERIKIESAKLPANVRKPATATVLSVAAQSLSGSPVTVELKLRVVEPGSDPYEKTSVVSWEKRGNQWLVIKVDQVSSTKKSKYLDE